MGAKFSKGGKVKQNGTDAALDESLDTFNKTSTLPASFRKKDAEITKSGTLPRGGGDLDRNTSFSKRFRKSITKLVGQKEVSENASESQVPTEPSSVVLGQEECRDKLKDVTEEEVDSKVETPHKEKEEVDMKTAQKRARAQFFQDLYNSKEPAHIPKPPRSRNIPSPLEQVNTDTDIKVPAAIGSPVVKLIEKHKEAIAKQHEHVETNNSINSPESENRRIVSDVYSESMIKDEVVCASDKQVENIKQEEVSVVKEEITMREETILKEEISMTQSTTMAASNDTKIEQEKSTVKIEDNISSYETESIAVTSLTSQETVLNEELSIAQSMTSNDTKIEQESSTVNIKENNISSYETESSAVTSLTSQETILNEEHSITQSMTMAASNDTKIEQENSTVNIKENIKSYETESIAVTSLTSQETILNEEHSISQSMTMAASNDTKIEQENSTMNIEENISSYETESIAVTSLTSENVETFSNVEITKEQAGDALYEAINDNEAELLEGDNNGVKGPEAIVNEEFQREVGTELIETEKNVENKSEHEQPKNEETEMTKDNGALYDSCQANKELTSQEEEDEMIDQSSFCNSQQEIEDSNFIEQDSPESINQNDEINRAMTEKEDTIESTGTDKSDTVIVDTGATGSDDLRSDKGSEGGVSTDEGIVATDDEENKSDFHKVDNLEAKENKSSEELSEQMEPENKL